MKKITIEIDEGLLIILNDVEEWIRHRLNTDQVGRFQLERVMKLKNSLKEAFDKEINPNG